MPERTEEGEFVRWHVGETDKVGKPAGRRNIARELAEALSVDASSVRTVGVSLTWLSTAFKMDLRTVKNRLGALKPLGPYGPRNAQVYDFSDACTLLAKPPPDQFARYMRTLRTQDMPTHLQETFWGALRKRQIWEQHAGELWKTSDVLDVLGEVFQTLKNTIQLWVDNLDPKGVMSDDQRDALTLMTDALLEELAQKLVEMPGRKRTGPSLEDADANPDSMVESDEDLIG